MARRRMFSLDIVESDHFFELPPTAQALYFHLGMKADDDGFVSSPKVIQRSVGVEQSDLVALINAGLVIQFDSGVVVITDWHAQNKVQNDRYRPTRYQVEKSALTIDEALKRYMLTECIHDVYTGKDSIDKDSIDKDSIDKERGDQENKVEGAGRREENQRGENLLDQAIQQQRKNQGITKYDKKT